MLEVTIPGTEYYDDETASFITKKDQKLALEHSLVSLAKWESKWKKPFLSKKEDLTPEENIDYVRCMTMTQNVDPLIYLNIPPVIFEQVNQYIGDPMTATWFSKTKRGKSSNEVVTAEILYQKMIALEIPFECQKWHLNRLLALIKVCALKGDPEKKMSKKDVYSQNRALNEARRKRLNSRG